MRLSIISVTNTQLVSKQEPKTAFMIKLYKPSKNFETTSYIAKTYNSMFDALLDAHNFAKHLDATKLFTPDKYPYVHIVPNLQKHYLQARKNFKQAHHQRRGTNPL